MTLARLPARPLASSCCSADCTHATLTRETATVEPRACEMNACLCHHLLLSSRRHTHLSGERGLLWCVRVCGVRVCGCAIGLGAAIAAAFFRRFFALFACLFFGNVLTFRYTNFVIFCNDLLVVGCESSIFVARLSPSLARRGSPQRCTIEAGWWLPGSSDRRSHHRTHSAGCPCVEWGSGGW